MTPTMIALELLSLAGTSNAGRAPILFVHGGFHGAWCWERHFMPHFAARGHDCHAVSIRDHGASKRTGRDRDWRLADYVADVRWAMEQIDQPPILVGHSLGGTVVQKLAAERSCTAMVLLAPSPIGGSNRAAVRMFASHPRAMMRAFGRGDLGAALPAFTSFFFSHDLAATERQWARSHLDGLTSLRAANDAFYFDPPKPRPRGHPVLVLSGADDWSIPRYKNERLARAYHGEHQVVPTAHDMMCDTRWHTAADAVDDWLTRHDL
jgi:pimeloyl-ACP methyl ester carboxylesterase